MFRQSTKDKINGWGQIFRFVTPVLITIALWILGDMRNQIRDVREDAKLVAVETKVYSLNHLEHHRVFEISLCERITSIETILRNGK